MQAPRTLVATACLALAGAAQAGPFAAEQINQGRDQFHRTCAQ